MPNTRMTTGGGRGLKEQDSPSNFLTSILYRRPWWQIIIIISCSFYRNATKWMQILLYPQHLSSNLPLLTTICSQEKLRNVANVFDLWPPLKGKKVWEEIIWKCFKVAISFGFRAKRRRFRSPFVSSSIVVVTENVWDCWLVTLKPNLSGAIIILTESEEKSVFYLFRLSFLLNFSSSSTWSPSSTCILWSPWNC